MKKTYLIKTSGEGILEGVLDDHGHLHISGSGLNETFFSPDSLPWKDDRNLIRSVDFADDVAVTDLTNWFWGCENLTEIRNWPQNLEKMQATCCDCHKLSHIPAAFPPDLIDMDEAFIRCYALTNIPDIPSKVIYAADAFADCTGLCGRLVIRCSLTQYAFMFQNAGAPDRGVTLDYSAACESAIDFIVATGADGHVKKGQQV